MKIIERGRSDLGSTVPHLSHTTAGRFSERHESGQLDHLTRGNVASSVRLADQYKMLHQGDVARRLGLHKQAAHAGIGAGASIRHSAALDGAYGRDSHSGQHYRGHVSPYYTQGSFRFNYHGPSHYPQHCWYPNWTHWVDWSWHHHCNPVWDPRPVWCRPIVYLAAPRWMWWDVPVWAWLPVVSSGTWIDVDPVVVGPRYDLQLLAVRFVDPGHPDEGLGPRYRVWFRNNSDSSITRPFDVLLLVSDDGPLAADLPQAGVRVTAIGAGDVQSVDIRLPIEVYSLGIGEDGQPAPYNALHVLVDAGREISETYETNNGSAIAPGDILPVDPAAFELDTAEAPAGGEVLVAGEGFGPEPGQVLVHLGGIEMEAEILGWYDLGVKLALPYLPLAAPTQADLIVIRADGAAANPLQLTVRPPEVGR